MRAKDAREVANVLGRSLHFAEPWEIDGIETAHGEILSYYAHRYPEIDLNDIEHIFTEARSGRFF